VGCLELLGCGWPPVEELQGLLRGGQDPGVGAAGGRIDGGRSEAREGGGVADARAGLAGVGQVPEVPAASSRASRSNVFSGSARSAGSGVPPGRQAAPVSGSRSTRTRPSGAKAQTQDWRTVRPLGTGMGWKRRWWWARAVRRTPTLSRTVGAIGSPSSRNTGPAPLIRARSADRARRASPGDIRAGSSAGSTNSMPSISPGAGRIAAIWSSSQTPPSKTCRSSPGNFMAAGVLRPAGETQSTASPRVTGAVTPSSSSSSRAAPCAGDSPLSTAPPGSRRVER
jgi:hypothetical protein